MKSRTSSFNITVLKKDITRFAPLWVLYIVCSLLMLMLLLTDSGSGYLMATNISQSLPFMVWVNAGYALLCAQLLFGDLFNSRMCNALHAMPMRREGWFAAHILAGVLFSFVPHLIFSLLTMPLMNQLWEVGLWWMLASDLQFLFFFGLAVLSMLCVGSRFAAVVVYGLLNILSMLVYWLLDTLYVPMLNGLVLNSEPFLLFCPLLQMTEYGNLVNPIREILSPSDVWPENYAYSYALGEGWGYLAVCAVIGLALLGLALAVYRRRNLESAGDFMAVKVLEPVFLAIYTITAGAMCYLFFDLFGSGSLPFLFVGVAIGFFTGQMLLMRTVRVFGVRQLIGFAVTIAVLGMSLILTVLDPMGLVTWVPEVNEVRSVTISDGIYSDFFDSYNYGRFYTTEDPEEIADILKVHQFAVDDASEPWEESTREKSTVTVVTEAPFVKEYLETGVPYSYFCVTYRLTNGLTAQRKYYIPIEGEQAQILRGYYSSMECLFGPDYTDVASLLELVDGVHIDTYGQLRTESGLEELLLAIEADCEAGTMARSDAFHPSSDTAAWLYITFSDDRNSSVEIRVYEDAVNTYNWLDQRGYLELPEEELYP